eukprot:5158890-Alexandrium_andersonii.AAC.1
MCIRDRSNTSGGGMPTPAINCRQGSKAIANGLGCRQPRRIGEWFALNGATAAQWASAAQYRCRATRRAHPSLARHRFISNCVS